jgi:hypothetical protein
VTEVRIGRFDDDRDLPLASRPPAGWLGMIFRIPKVLKDTLIDKGRALSIHRSVLFPSGRRFGKD